MPSVNSCSQSSHLPRLYATSVSATMRSTVRIFRQNFSVGSSSIGVSGSRIAACDAMLGGMADGGVPFTSCSKMSWIIHSGQLRMFALPRSPTTLRYAGMSGLGWCPPSCCSATSSLSSSRSASTACFASRRDWLKRVALSALFSASRARVSAAHLSRRWAAASSSAVSARASSAGARLAAAPPVVGLRARRLPPTADGVM